MIRRITRIFWSYNDSRPQAPVRILCQYILFYLISRAIYETMAFWGWFNLMTEPMTPMENLLDECVYLIAVLFSVLISIKVLDKKPLRSIGLKLNRVWWQELLFGFVASAFIALSCIVFEISIGWIVVDGFLWKTTPSASFTIEILTALFAMGIFTFAAEVMYRGYMLTNLMEFLHRFGARQSLVLSILLLLILNTYLYNFDLSALNYNYFNWLLTSCLLFLSYALTGQLAFGAGYCWAWYFTISHVADVPFSEYTGNQPTFLKITYEHVGGYPILHPPVSWSQVLWMGGLIFGIAILIFWSRYKNGAWFKVVCTGRISSEFDEMH